MLSMLITFEVSTFSGWLYELAESNMPCMLVALDVLHALTSSLNVAHAALQPMLALHESERAQKT